MPGLGSFQLSHPQGGTPYLVAELFWPSEDAFQASAATPEMAETRKHAEACGTTFTVYTGDVAVASVRSSGGLPTGGGVEASTR